MPLRFLISRIVFFLRRIAANSAARVYRRKIRASTRLTQLLDIRAMDGADRP